MAVDLSQVSSVDTEPGELPATMAAWVIRQEREGEPTEAFQVEEIGGSAPGIEQQTGPISPGDTASLKANLRQGTYRVAVDGGGIADAALDVGRPRPSAQDQLLQP